MLSIHFSGPSRLLRLVDFLKVNSRCTTNTWAVSDLQVNLSLKRPWCRYRLNKYDNWPSFVFATIVGMQAFWLTMLSRYPLYNSG